MKAKILLLLVCITLSFSSQAEQRLVRIGVLAFNGAAYTLKRWQPTIDYLNSALPDYHFVIVPADIPTLDHLVESNLIDFTLTNGIQFLFYKYNHQAVKMLNLNPYHGEAKHAIGSALIGRVEEPSINSLKEITDRSIISVSENAFGGFRVMLREFLAEGIKKGDLKNLTFIGYPQQQLLTKVIDGEADFAIAPTCLLERKVRDGTIEAGKLKVIHKQHPDSPFACHTSSQLYPNWTLARMRHVPADYANHIARILLTIPINSQIAVTGLYGGWSVPIDDSAIYELMDEIGINVQTSYLSKLWLTYRGWVMAFAGLLILFIAYHFRVNYLVHVRSSQLRKEIENHNKTSSLLENETNQLFKAQRVLLSGEMASGLAHELNQPLMAISTYATGCKNRLDKYAITHEQLVDALEKIEHQTLQASSIIQRMRNFMKINESKRELTSIQELITTTLLIFKHTFEKEHIHVTKEMDDTNVIIDPVLIQQVIANLIQNSIDALKETPKLNRVITIGTKVSEQQVFLSISDNGCGISDEQLYELFMPFKSNKETGLGLGMVICKRIIEAHQGTIHVKQLAQGTQFSIAFPLTQPKEPS